MAYFLVKQDPANYPFEQFQKEKKTDWTGDDVLFYHSGDEKAVVGLSSVSKAAFPDPTADDDAWIAVELKAGKKLKNPVPLAAVKADPKLKEILLVRNGRISVMALSKVEFERIVELSE
jgi:predicted RNA-binding protein with PUA-like domain